MRNALLTCVAAIGLVGVCASACAPEPGATPTTTTPAAGAGSTGIPNLAADQTWITSVPAGVRVYSSDTEAGLISPGNLAGVTPLTLNKRPRFVALALDDPFEELSIPYIITPNDFLDVSARSHSGTISVDAQGEGTFTIVHTYEMDYSQGAVLIGLFQPRDLSLQQLEKIYPSTARFEFDDGAVRQFLLKEGVAQDLSGVTLRLLHKGGKVAVQQGDKVLVFQVAAVPSAQPVGLRQPRKAQ